jgi:6-pyruvoyltetrahydropterin/6-carboxytetrahydropterin synthase
MPQFMVALSKCGRILKEPLAHAILNFSVIRIAGLFTFLCLRRLQESAIFVFEVSMYQIRVEASFAAAHFLSHYRGKCERLHGHNYRVRVWASGESLDDGGMLLDFGELKGALRGVLEALDHSLLNDLPEFKDDPSAERIAEYVFRALAARLSGAPLAAVDVFETETSMARYEP